MDKYISSVVIGTTILVIFCMMIANAVYTIRKGIQKRRYEKLQRERYK